MAKHLSNRFYWLVASIFILPALTLSGCATQLQTPAVSSAAVSVERELQKEMALSIAHERLKKLNRVSQRLRVNSVDICRKKSDFVFGLLWNSLSDVPTEYQGPATRIWGLRDELTIMQVIPGLPADVAGIKTGDVVLAIDGSEVKSGVAGQKALSNALVTPANLEVRRNGKILSLTLRGISSAPIQTIYYEGDELNAFADGGNVYVTTGMIKFTESDDELAFAVAHEMAHNILGHMRRQKTNSAIGWVLGATLDVASAFAGVDTQGAWMKRGSQVGAQAFSQQFEAEADYFGSYIVARAGYDVSESINFWRRIAVEHSTSIAQNYLATHPSTPERSASLQVYIVEIESKRRGGLPLVPLALK